MAGENDILGYQVARDQVQRQGGDTSMFDALLAMHKQKQRFNNERNQAFNPAAYTQAMVQPPQRQQQPAMPNRNEALRPRRPYGSY